MSIDSFLELKEISCFSICLSTEREFELPYLIYKRLGGLVFLGAFQAHAVKNAVTALFHLPRELEEARCRAA